VITSSCQKKAPQTRRKTKAKPLGKVGKKKKSLTSASARNLGDGRGVPSSEDRSGALSLEEELRGKSNDAERCFRKKWGKFKRNTKEALDLKPGGSAGRIEKRHWRRINPTEGKKKGDPPRPRFTLHKNCN